MKSMKKRHVQADNLITRLEDLLLATPASELATAARNSSAVDTVRRIIGDQIAACERLGTRASARRTSQDLLSPTPGRHASSTSHARAVFGKNGESAQDKVEELISSLSKDRKESKGSDKK